jgi:hypothetical protein
MFLQYSFNVLVEITMSNVVLYYFISDGQDGSASLRLYKTKEARDRAQKHDEENYGGIGALDVGTITQDEIDNAQTLEDVETEIEEDA